MNLARKVFAISLPSGPAWLTGLLAAMWGSIPGMIQTYLLLACADWVIGAVNAAARREFCVRASLEGLWRKVVTLILIGVAHRVLEPLKLPLDVCNTIAVAFVVNEAISVVLNAADIGVPIPPALVEVLARARKLTGRGRSADDVREEIDGGKPKAKAAEAE